MAIFISAEGYFPKSASAQEVQSIVDAGSSGNEVSVELENISQEQPLEKILMTLTDHSSDLKDITVTPTPLMAIPPGGKASFQVRFNVHEKAEPGAVLRMKFSLLTRRGAFADSSPVVLVLVKPKEAEEEPPPPPPEMEPGPGGLPVFVLSEIKGERSFTYAWYTMEWDGKSPGHVERWTKKRSKDLTTIRMSAITKYPKKIVLGKPFSFSAKSKSRVFNNKRCVKRGKKHKEHYAHIRPRSHIGGADIMGTKDLVAFCDEAGVYKTNNAGRRYRASVRAIHKDGDVQATFTFKPTKILRDDKGRPGEFYYKVELSTDGKVFRPLKSEERYFMGLRYGRKGKERVIIDSNGIFEKADGVDSISIGIVDRSLKYLPALRTSEPLSPPPFKAPEGMGEMDAGPEREVSPEAIAGAGPSSGGSILDAATVGSQGAESSSGRADSSPNGRATSSSDGAGQSGDPSPSTDIETSIDPREGIPIEPPEPEDSTIHPEETAEIARIETPRYPVSGEFTSSSGKINFHATGPRVAVFGGDQGRLWGDFSGMVLTGFWVEKGSDQRCGAEKDGSFYWGRIQFTFDETFDSFKGVWSYCDKEPKRAWTGKRIGGPTLPQDQAKKYPVSGAFSSNEGKMDFHKSGPRVAHYSHENGRIIGDFSGKVLSGYWAQTGSARKCASEKDGSYYWGRIFFTFDEAFDSFKGFWGYCDREPLSPWQGKRIVAEGGQADGFLGCFKDQGEGSGTRGRDLNGLAWSDAAMTHELCVSKCSGNGFAYAGVQYGKWCFCGNQYGKSGPATNCDIRCAGDPNQICGGSWANSVYQVPYPAN